MLRRAKYRVNRLTDDESKLKVGGVLKGMRSDDICHIKKINKLVLLTI
jgi:hypothetical protein